MIYLKEIMDCDDFVVIAKPDAVERGLVGKIISAYEKRNFKLFGLNYTLATIGQITEHYNEHINKDFFDELVKFTLRGPIVVMKFYGNIANGRQVMSQLRSEYSDNHIFRENIVHCSDSKESAKNEINIWF